jgi:hypothetical protein
MVYPHAVRHQRGPLRLAATRGWCALNDGLDRDVPPLDAPLATGFVVGCGNSGTTLVAARLGNHPRAFVIPHETGMFRPTRRLARTRRKLQAWMHEARAAGARVVIEKTPKHVHAIGRLRRLLPEARVILVVRNPYDTCLSLKKRFGDLGFAIARWRLDNAAGLALRDDPRATVLRYERLTADPAAELARVLGFLGLDWHPAVLADGATAYDEARQRFRLMERRAAQVRQPIRANSGQWRRQLTAAEIALIRAETAVVWRALGGDPEGDGYLD